MVRIKIFRLSFVTCTVLTGSCYAEKVFGNETAL